MMLHSYQDVCSRVRIIRSHRSTHRTARAFSLLELVIVIAIVAALIALALPSLRGVHQRSRKTQELSNLRQVGMAWFMYAQANNDYALPGYLEPDVQSTWDVAYDYPKAITSNELIGRKVPVDIAAPWTWRLMPFLSDAGKILRAHLEENDYELLDLIEHSREVALEPAFGYNGYYVGGYWKLTPGENPRPTYRFASARDANGYRVNVVARSPSSIQNSDHLIVFCSSTLRDEGLFQRGPNDVPGFHFAVPPVLADTRQWETPSNYIANLEDDPKPNRDSGDSYTVRTLTTSPTPVGRYTGAAAIFYADGHTDAQTPGALDDQSLWIMGARQVGDIPARDFTHTDD